MYYTIRSKKCPILAIEYGSTQYISLSPDIFDVYNLFDKPWDYKIDLVDMSFFFFLISSYLFIYLFMFGCVGSLFLCEGFL